MKYTADELHKLDRPVLESRVLQLQAYLAAVEARAVTARQRAVLIEQHVKRLVNHLCLTEDGQRKLRGGK